MIILPVVLPLLTAFLLQPLERVSRPLARLAGPTVLIACAWIIWDIGSTRGGVPFTVMMGGFAAPLGIAFYADRLALLFALAVPLFGLLLWPRRERAGRTREEALLLLLLAAGSGMALSGDLFNLYVFYELMAIASLGLMAAPGTGRAFLATIRYLFISGLGSILTLLGITVLYLKTGALNLGQLAQLGPDHLNNPLGLTGFALLLIGFGVKAELFPVNTWVPEVYATAPQRVSALLAGLMSKLALLVVVRLLVLVFPQPGARTLMLFLGLLGMVSGELAAWRARDFPRLLAYSSIGQLGLAFIAFSLPGPGGMLAGLAVALHHLVVLPALFALAERWNGSLDRLTGAAAKAPFAAGQFVLFALSLSGVPPLPGFWTKMLVLVGLAQQAQPLHWVAFAALLMATVVEAHYMFRLALGLYRKVEHAPSRRPARWDLVTAGLLAAVLLAVTLTIAPVTDALRGVARQAADRAAYIATVYPR